MTKKISELTAVSAALAADEMEVNEAGTSKKTTIQQIADLFQSIWTSLQFGGTSAGFPMLKRSTTALQVKLADDSAFTDVQSASLTMAAPTRTPKWVTYVATVSVTAAATTGKEAAIAIPANFLGVVVGIEVTGASTNAVNLNDVGDDADTDSFCDGLSIAINSTGFKGWYPCNGIRGNPGGTSNLGGSMATPDEVEIVISGVPGNTTTMQFTFVGIVLP